MTRSHRRARRLPRRPLAAVAWVLVLLAATLALPGASAGFSAVTRNSGDAWATDGVSAPTGLAAAQACTTTPIAFRAATTNTGTEVLTLTVPPVTVAGDLLLAQIAHTWTGAPFTVPAGWNHIRTDNSANTVVSALYWKRAVTGDSSATFSFPPGSSVTMGGAMAAYTGADTTAPVDAQNGQVGTGATAITPSVTTTTAGTLVVRFITNAHESYPVPAGTTQRWRVGTVPGMGGFGAGDEQFAGSGSAGSRTSSSPSGTSAAGVGQTVALRRAPGTPSANLSWTASTSPWATGYRLERSGGGAPPSTRELTPIGTSTATEGPLANGTTYTFRLWAYRGTWTSSVVTTTLTPSC